VEHGTALKRLDCAGKRLPFAIGCGKVREDGARAEIVDQSHSIVPNARSLKKLPPIVRERRALFLRTKKYAHCANIVSAIALMRIAIGGLVCINHSVADNAW
jgi:hypothetical protein